MQSLCTFHETKIFKESETVKSGPSQLSVKKVKPTDVAIQYPDYPQV